MIIRYLKKILLLLFASLLLLPAHAGNMFQPQPVRLVKFEIDSAHPSIKHFSTDINSYKKSRDFRYHDAPAEGGLMSIISYYLERFFSKVFSSRVGDTSIYTLLLYGLMIFGVIMLIFQFFKISPQSLLRRSSTTISVDSLDGDNIHEIDFDKLIQQSVSQQDYRLAVRFWYLKMLKIMSDAQLIKWQISKTNYDYYYELKQQQLRNDFLALTHTFENSWYGNHKLNGERYHEATASFQKFFSTLNHRER